MASTGHADVAIVVAALEAKIPGQAGDFHFWPAWPVDRSSVS
jgi:hypothetical protein